MLLNRVAIVAPSDKLEVLQDGSFDAKREIIAFTGTERNSAKAHFPTVEVAIDIYGRKGERPSKKIVSAGEGELPARGEIEITTEKETLGKNGSVGFGKAGILLINIHRVSHIETPGHIEINVSIVSSILHQLLVFVCFDCRVIIL